MEEGTEEDKVYWEKHPVCNGKGEGEYIISLSSTQVSDVEKGTEEDKSSDEKNTRSAMEKFPSH